MKRPIQINALIHNLLIEKKMDGFSITEVRDALLFHTGESLNPAETRKKVYRQILRLEKKEWLYSDGSGRNKRYFKSEVFKQQSLLKDTNNEFDIELGRTASDYSVLKVERDKHAGELEITLNEIDECRSIISRFPDLEKELAPFQQELKDRSTSLLGKLNVLTYVIKVLSKGRSSC
ncbi:hypothetical protein [Vibrio rumoiensis]|uniref:Transcriptional regulator VspR n=1 Tax=Vibrio rumoiensis TaxID=76258 RepID=A0ABW7ISY6_9VIBR